MTPESCCFFNSAGEDNNYNVVMVGNSGVGKTSFMRRAQNGKFSQDLPASVGKSLVSVGLTFPDTF